MPIVKQLRMLTGLTQVDFAAKYHVKIDTYRMWEQGVNRTPAYVSFMMRTILEYEGVDTSSVKGEG